MSQCIAKASVLRCVGCFAFPFCGLAAYGYKIRLVGDGFHSYLSHITAGGFPLVSALLFFGGCIAWMVVTWPKAMAALQHAHCTIKLNDRTLTLYEDQLELKDIAAIDTWQRPLDSLLRITRVDGSTLQRSVVLLSPSSQVIVERLRSTIF